MMDPLDREYTTSCGHTWTMRHTACPECFAALHEENARLKDELLDRNGHVLRLTRERDEARAKLARCVEVAKSSPLVSYTPVDGEAIRVVPVSVVLAANFISED